MALLLILLLGLAWMLAVERVSQDYVYYSPSQERSLVVSEGCLGGYCFLDVVVKERTSLFWFSDRRCQIIAVVDGKAFADSTVTWHQNEQHIAWRNNRRSGFIVIERDCTGLNL